MKTLKAKIKLIGNGKVPTKKRDTDACYDMYAQTIEWIDYNLVGVSLGVSIQPEPAYRVAIYPRSSLSKTGWVLANSIGIGDFSFRGVYKAYFAKVNYIEPTPVKVAKENGEFFQYYPSKYPFPYNVGDRVCQMELVPYHNIDFEIADELEPTDRGTGGFGSTEGMSGTDHCLT